MYFDWLFFIDKCGFYFNLYHMVKHGRVKLEVRHKPPN